MKNVINWFEIPTTKLDRAVKFYEAIFKITLKVEDMMGMKMAVFPHERDGVSVGGALVQAENYEPSTAGTLPYLNGGDDLNTILSRVEKAGGKVIMPKMQIGENGYIAMFIDSEGNKIGLHSMGVE
jgi:predicted enzyme related to lactoylglutathione lyase